MVTVRYTALRDLLASNYVDLMVEINLNGGIVSNKGFIRQMVSSASIIPGKYISAWGGVQSAGQTIGQIVCPLNLQG